MSLERCVLSLFLEAQDVATYIQNICNWHLGSRGGTYVSGMFNVGAKTEVRSGKQETHTHILFWP